MSALNVNHMGRGRRITVASRLSAVVQCLLLGVFALCVMAAPQTLSAQRKTTTVRGVVTDAQTQEPLVGVTCIVEGSQKGTTTGIDGSFELQLAKSDQAITFSYIGYKTQIVDWAGQTSLNIELNEDAALLDEVIVVGYGSQKKSDITGAVGSVSKDRIEKMVSTDIAQMMQGAVPGLNVMTTEAGANPEGQSGLMLIRGRNSISASNEPLIVLDGVPYWGAISDINPGDIASIEVLKDASSAAIYGSRGANGVILITTRQGTEGKVKITYDGYYAIQTVANFPHIMNGDEYVEYKRGWEDDGDDNPDDTGLNATERAVYEDGSWRDWTWKDLLTRRGSSMRHSISATGGTKALKYNVGLNYLRNEGVIINDQYQRAQLRTNLTVTLTSWLTYTTNTMLTWSDNSGATPKFVDVFNKSPLLRPFNEDGSINILPDASNEKRVNPLESQLYDDYNAQYKVSTSNSFKAKLAKGLTYTLNTGIQYFSTEHNEYQGRNTAAMKSYNGWGKISNKKKFAYSLENILNYQRNFGKHGLFLTLVYSFESNTNRIDELEGTDFPNDLLSYNGITQAKQLTPYISKTETKLISQMGRVNYDYDSRYLFSFTVRRDGYSGFGTSNKWGVFPSVAVGWNIANEPFFERAKEYVNTLKLRLSWGRNGNQAISAFQTISKLGNSDYVDGTGLAAGYSPSSLGTPNLSWETTESFNIGLDYALLQSRITGEINFYRNNTYDLLLQRSISSVNGLESIWQNIGKTRNEGVEFTISSTNINTRKFRWKTSLNLAFIRTQIRDLYGNGLDDVDNKWFIGSPIRVNYDYYITGVWQSHEANLAALYGAKPGYAKYDDKNGNGAYDAGDRQIIGSPEPNVTWSVNNQFTYGPLDLVIYIYGAHGMVKGNPFYARNILVPHNYWTPENPTNDYWSKDDKSANQYIASKTVTPGYYQRADFWRIKDITLSYTLPKQWLSRLGVSNTRVYFSCKNPFTFTDYTGMDPELDEQRAKPVYQEYIFGLNLTF